MTRILVVSPVPTHPTNAGNRARINSMLASLESAGHELTIIYSAREPDSFDEMQAYWGEKLVVTEHRDAGFMRGLRWIPKARRILRRLNINAGYYFGLDEWFNPLLTELIEKTIVEREIEAVLVEYVFLSKALLAVPDHIPKLLDTHDVFADRHRRYLDSGLTPSWFSCTPRAEARGLNRADYVIAIQDREAALLRDLTQRPVITIGHLAEIGSARASSPQNTSFDILTVGSANRINIESTQWFIDQVFPLIRANHAQTRLIVAGDLCRELSVKDGVELRGRVEDLTALYQSANLVVNPMLTGTGLKIKSIEALGHGCPLLTTNAGAAGLEESANTAFLLANTPEEFAAATARLQSNPTDALELGKRGRDWAVGYNKSCIAELAQLLP